MRRTIIIASSSIIVIRVCELLKYDSLGDLLLAGEQEIGVMLNFRSDRSREDSLSFELHQRYAAGAA